MRKGSFLLEKGEARDREGLIELLQGPAVWPFLGGIAIVVPEVCVLNRLQCMHSTRRVWLEACRTGSMLARHGFFCARVQQQRDSAIND